MYNNINLDSPPFDISVKLQTFEVLVNNLNMSMIVLLTSTVFTFILLFVWHSKSSLPQQAGITLVVTMVINIKGILQACIILYRIIYFYKDNLHNLTNIKQVVITKLITSSLTMALAIIAIVITFKVLRKKK